MKTRRSASASTSTAADPAPVTACRKTKKNQPKIPQQEHKQSKPKCFLCLDSSGAAPISRSSPIPKIIVEVLGLSDSGKEHFVFFKSLCYCTNCMQLLLNYKTLSTNFLKLRTSLLESTKFIREIVLKNYDGLSVEHYIDNDINHVYDATEDYQESEPEINIADFENASSPISMMNVDPIDIEIEMDLEDFQLNDDDDDDNAEEYENKPSFRSTPKRSTPSKSTSPQKSHANQPLSLRACNKCDKSFKTRKLLQEHIRDIHYKVVECPTCSKSIPEPILQTHIKFEHSESSVGKSKVKHCSRKKIEPNEEDGRYHCKVENCEKSYKTARYLEDHILTTHNENRDKTQVNCPVCDKVCGDRIRLKYHIINTHKKKLRPPKPKVPKPAKPPTEENDQGEEVNQQSEKTFECSICHKTYKSARNLREHKVSHKDGQSVICPFCGGLYDNKNKLRWHMRAVHRTQTFPCDQCSYEAKTKNSLTSHQAKIHSTSKETWTCEICGKVIHSSLHTFLNHKRKMHELGPGQKPLSCNLCGKTFALRDYLRDHVIKKHIKVGLGGSSTVNKKDIKIESTDPTLVDLCKELNINLHNHIKTETYKCAFCPKFFPMKNYLKSHMRKFHLFRKGKKFEKVFVDQDTLAKVCTDLNLPIPIHPVIQM